MTDWHVSEIKRDTPVRESEWTWVELPLGGVWEEPMGDEEVPVSVQIEAQVGHRITTSEFWFFMGCAFVLGAIVGIVMFANFFL